MSEYIGYTLREHDLRICNIDLKKKTTANWTLLSQVFGPVQIPIEGVSDCLFIITMFYRNSCT